MSKAQLMGRNQERDYDDDGPKTSRTVSGRCWGFFQVPDGRYWTCGGWSAGRKTDVIVLLLVAAGTGYSLVTKFDTLKYNENGNIGQIV